MKSKLIRSVEPVEPLRQKSLCNEVEPDHGEMIYPPKAACRRRHDIRPLRKKGAWSVRTTNWRSRFSH